MVLIACRDIKSATARDRCARPSVPSSRKKNKKWRRKRKKLGAMQLNATQRQQLFALKEITIKQGLLEFGPPLPLPHLLSAFFFKVGNTFSYLVPWSPLRSLTSSLRIFQKSYDAWTVRNEMKDERRRDELAIIIITASPVTLLFRTCTYAACPSR